MGKATGFLEFERKSGGETSPKERIKHFQDFHEHLLKREQEQQAARCMDCGVPFCQSGMMIKGMTSGCPLNNLIPEWNDLIYLEKPDRALGRLLKTNSFPEFTSRVCPAPCEAACTCGLNDTPVTIKENEWSIIENGYANGLIQPNPPKVRTGKKIAVVGSGPSGLAAADQLNKRGHSVVVFERND
ncbi:NAD(P)-binding protein, partial [Anaerotignum sp.]|uniref:NAD(P)-binding protein n=1 Tax=Anaerotignum sp. TaxID=2039241 RepID=UPI00289C7077